MSCYFSKLIVVISALFLSTFSLAETSRPDNLEGYTLISASISGYGFIDADGVTTVENSSIIDMVDSDEKCAKLAESREGYTQSLYIQDPQEVSYASLWVDGKKRNPAESGRLALQIVELCYAK